MGFAFPVQASGLRAVAARLRDTLLPPVCLACDDRVAVHGTVCPACWSDLQFIERPFCAVTGLPFSHDFGGDVRSGEAIADPPDFDTARAAVLYGEVAQRLVRSLKFSDRTDLAPWMARWMADSLRRTAPELLSGNPVVVPVPLHRSRLIGRRFNQSAELARPLARELGLTYLPDTLIRHRATRQQIGLEYAQRRNNVSGAFRVPKEKRIAIENRAVLLIDDVNTTGATLNACARALKRAGAARVDCATFARVARGEH